MTIIPSTRSTVLIADAEDARGISRLSGCSASRSRGSRSNDRGAQAPRAGIAGHMVIPMVRSWATLPTLEAGAEFGVRRQLPDRPLDRVLTHPEPSCVRPAACRRQTPRHISEGLANAAKSVGWPCRVDGCAGRAARFRSPGDAIPHDADQNRTFGTALRWAPDLSGRCDTPASRSAGQRRDRWGALASSRDRGGVAPQSRPPRAWSEGSRPSPLDRYQGG